MCEGGGGGGTQCQENPVQWLSSVGPGGTFVGNTPDSAVARENFRAQSSTPCGAVNIDDSTNEGGSAGGGKPLKQKHCV